MPRGGGGQSTARSQLYWQHSAPSAACLYREMASLRTVSLSWCSGGGGGISVGPLEVACGGPGGSVGRQPAAPVSSFGGGGGDGGSVHSQN